MSKYLITYASGCEDRTRMPDHTTTVTADSWDDALDRAKALLAPAGAMFVHAHIPGGDENSSSLVHRLTNA